jgi:prepilin signal peptidase PulO-like enzyme (type II secretory pathway)
VKILLRLIPVAVALLEGLLLRYLIIYIINKRFKEHQKSRLVLAVFHPVSFILFIIYPSITYHLWMNNNEVLNSLLTSLLIGVFICLLVVDWYIYKLPNSLNLLAVILTVAILYNSKNDWPDSLSGLTAALVIGFIIFGIGYFKYRKIVFGMGDIKLLAIIGLISGINHFQFVFLGGTLLATVYALLGVGLGVFTMKSTIPLGTFLCISVIVYLLI